MKRRTFLTNTSLATAALAAGLGASHNASAAARRRPNVIVILTDDQGLGDFGFTGKGAEFNL